MRAMVTVTGSDHVGIIAFVCTLLAKNNINILDITQTVLQEYFTMFMLVDLSGCTSDLAIISDTLRSEGEKEGLEIRIQRCDIFDAMHKI